MNIIMKKGNIDTDLNIPPQYSITMIQMIGLKNVAC